MADALANITGSSATYGVTRWLRPTILNEATRAYGSHEMMNSAIIRAAIWNDRRRTCELWGRSRDTGSGRQKMKSSWTKSMYEETVLSTKTSKNESLNILFTLFPFFLSPTFFHHPCYSLPQFPFVTRRSPSSFHSLLFLSHSNCGYRTTGWQKQSQYEETAWVEGRTALQFYCFQYEGNYSARASFLFLFMFIKLNCAIFYNFKL